MLAGFREDVVRHAQELTPHVEKETIEEALGKDKKADAFLLDYGKALREAKKLPEAKAALQAVMEQWPKTDRAIEAERILTEMK
jgi:TolA-binding protein